MSVTAKRNILTAAIIAMFMLIACFIMVYAKTPAAAKSPERPKFFTSYEIKSGDTLIGIAKRFMTPEYAYEDEYIAEVKSINGFSGNTL